MHRIVKKFTEDTMTMLVLVILLFWIFLIERKVEEVDHSLKTRINYIERIIRK